MLDIVKEYIWVLLISMVPVIELRGAIPIGLGFGLDVVPTFIVAIVGNILPVPFLILFSKKIVAWLASWRYIGPIFQKIMRRAEKSAGSIGRYELLGLMLFVGVPLPGTGAWTGSLIAALLGLRVRNAFAAIALGVVIAGVIMSLASAGLLGALNHLFEFRPA